MEEDHQPDTNSFGQLRIRGTGPISRPDAVQFVERDDPYYNMNHTRRGVCLIFSNETFSPKLNLSERKCAKNDAKKCYKAFSNLGFEVQVYLNKTKKEFQTITDLVCEENHSNCDALAVIFMSHGDYDENAQKEILYTSDAKIYPEDLWKKFVGQGCLTLVGKPKLFFIQACRGTGTDKGVRVVTPLRVCTDSLPASVTVITKKYVLPSHADLLVMWASYPGHYAFKTQNNGIDGSVFIHFLSKILDEEGFKKDLFSLLLTVTRNVALEYESNFPSCDSLDNNKQIPFMESTLIRNLHFKSKICKI